MSLTPPEGYRHHISMTIRFADIDRLDHVNNAMYLTSHFSPET